MHVHTGILLHLQAGDQPDVFLTCTVIVFVRLYCAVFRFQANIVEEYVPLSASQLVGARLKTDKRPDVVFWIDEWYD